MTVETLAATGAVFAGLFAAHQVADHWVQTQHQATTKSRPGWRGRLACIRHVASYTAVAALALVALALFAGLELRPGPVAAGLLISAATHYVADRRTPLQWVADRIGSGQFWRLGAPRPGRDDNPTLGGAYALDQSWHTGWLFVATLIIV